jgi:hypothetical protein
VQHDGPWAAEFAQARASTDNPTLLKILEDDKITDAELAQAKQLEIDCDAESGLKARVKEDGWISVEDTPNLPQDQFDAIERECETLSSPVTGLYQIIQWNPNHEDQITVILACFKKFHVVNDSMTVDQLKAVNFNNPPWNLLSGDANGCETQMAAYAGGESDLTEPFIWTPGAFGSATK